MTVKVDKLLEEGTFQRVSDPPLPPGVSFPSAWAAESEFLIEDAKSNPALPSNMVFHSTQTVSELEMGSTSSVTCYSAPPPVPMELSEGFEYKLPFTKEVLEALQDDRVKIIGISGIVGGEEAVTLKEFMQRVDHLFEDVAVAVVSPNPNLEHIQDEIAALLGLDMENENLIERAKLLSDRMAKASKRFLIILVDIWQTFNLEAVGISHVGVGNGCKIILMSQNPNVFSAIRNQSSFKLISVSITNIGGSILDFESRNSIFRQVMDDLKDDRINPILICGLGGVGKTTMVRQIGNKAKEQGLFNELVMVDVTQNASIKNIQDQIADYLGLVVSNYSGLTARAQKLYERLSRSKRVLVILDNVWTRLDLKEVGIPSPRQRTGCKILVTSRNQDVFNEIKTKKRFKIDVLPESEAWSLFKDAAGSSIESPHFRPIAEQVLSECGGLPIAISTVGRALQNKSKEIWSNALKELRKANPDHISGMEKDVYQSINLSYDSLQSKEAKSCFLLCCLYPESSNIAIEKLLRHRLGLGLFKDIELIEEGRNSVLASIDILKTCFLLLDSNKEGCVKMHDVVRDAGLSIASSNEYGFVARQGLQLKDWPKSGFEYEYTSTVLVKGARTELLLASGTDFNSREPRETIFDGMEELEVSSETIFDGMEELKVLDLKMTNLGWSISSSLSQMKHLQTLCLEHFQILDISMIGQIQTLMILSLRGSRIGNSKLPSEIGNLSNLRSLDWTGCHLYNIGPDVISRLVKLEELYMMGNSHRPLFNNRWARAAYYKTMSLKNLTTLETTVPQSPEFFQHTILFEKLDRFYITHKTSEECWRGDVNYCGNRLVLTFKDHVVAGSVINELLKKARIVELEKVRFGDLNERWFVNVKSLTLRNCAGLEYLSDARDIRTTSPCCFSYAGVVEYPWSK